MSATSLSASTADPSDPSIDASQLPSSTPDPTESSTETPKPTPRPTQKPASTPTSIAAPHIPHTTTDPPTSLTVTSGGSSNSPSSSSNSSNLPFTSAIAISGDLPITGSPVTPTSSQSPAAVVSTAALVNASKRTSLSPIVGGAVGGVVFLAILVVAASIFFLKRRLRVHGGETVGLPKQAQAPTPYEYNQPHLLSTDGSADLKGGIPRTSISNASTAATVPLYTSELNGEVGTSERGGSNHSESPGPQMKEQSQNLGVDTSNLNRRLTTHTVTSQQTADSEALPPYKQFSATSQ